MIFTIEQGSLLIDQKGTGTFVRQGTICKPWDNQVQF